MSSETTSRNRGKEHKGMLTRSLKFPWWSVAFLEVKSLNTLVVLHCWCQTSTVIGLNKSRDLFLTNTSCYWYFFQLTFSLAFLNYSLKWKVFGRKDMRNLYCYLKYLISISRISFVMYLVKLATVCKIQNIISVQFLNNTFLWMSYCKIYPSAC